MVNLKKFNSRMKMPNIKFLGQYSPHSKGHMKEQVQALGRLNSNTIYADVIFHCKSKRMFTSSKLLLAHCSQFLSTIFTPGSDLDIFQPVTYTFLCPGFEPTAMYKVMEILNTGQTLLQVQDAKLYQDICFILKSLQIDINLTDPGIWNHSFQHQNLDPNIMPEYEHTPTQSLSSTTRWSNSGTASHSFGIPTPLLEDYTTSNHTNVSTLPIKSIYLEHTNYKTTPIHSVNTNQSVNISADTYTSTLMRPTDTSKKFLKHYLCKICDKDFQFSISYEKHMKKHGVIKSKKSADLDNDLQILKENLSGCSINELANLSATHSGQKSVESAQSSDSSTSICCQLCPAVRKYPQDMKFHYALSHFSEKFEEYFVQNKGACKFCSKIFLNRTQQIGHLLSVHKFVQNLIPYVGKIPERKAQLQNQIISDPDPGIQNRIFSCHICNEEFTRRFKLVCHMSLKHYRDELKKYYGEEVSIFHFIYTFAYCSYIQS